MPEISISLLQLVLERVRRNPRLRQTLRRLLAPTLGNSVSRYIWDRPDRYDQWIARHDTLSLDDISAIRAHIADLPVRPLISVAMAVHNTPEAYLRSAIASVRAQLWSDWELCLCDDASFASHVERVRQETSAEDPRIRWVRSEKSDGFSAASNKAAALARGAWVIPVDPNDLLPAHALYEIGLAAIAEPAAEIVYFDEDRLDGDGVRSDPYFKSDFDPDLMLVQNLIGNACAYRTDLFRRVGGFRSGLKGSWDHDLALRAVASAGADAVHHIPRVLYHRRSQPGTRPTMARYTPVAVQVIQEFLETTGQPDARVEPSPIAPDCLRVVWPVPDPAPLVSIIVPTRDKADLLGPCIESVLHRTEYPAIEVLIADNGSEGPETLALFKRWRDDPRVRVLHMSGPFNYSRINNQAVAEAKGEIILLLNNDTEVIERGWLREMVSHAVRPGIGAVGAKLLYENDTVQHAGVLLGMGWPHGAAGHIYNGAKRNCIGAFGLLSVVRGVSAVTAACLAVRRDTFLAVGGLDEENLAVAFNDVDLCLRLRNAGYRNIWSPFAELYHKESASRGRDLGRAKANRFGGEIDTLRRRWAVLLDNDPFWNPNLSLVTSLRRLARQPRQEKSWARYLKQQRPISVASLT